MIRGDESWAWTKRPVPIAGSCGGGVVAPVAVDAAFGSDTAGRVVASVYRSQLHTIAGFYAEQFGIPVMFANKAFTGTMWTPVSLLPVARIPLAFEGGSSIHAGDGQMIAAAASRRETVLVDDVRLDPTTKKRPPALPSGYWRRSQPCCRCCSVE